MGRPLKAVYANTTYSTGVREMSNTDILDLSSSLVANYVTANRPLYTILGINDSNTSASSIGTVVDSNWGPVGSAPSYSSTTTTFSIRAGTTTIPTDIVRPVQYTQVGDEIKIQEISDSDLITYFFAPIVNYISSGGQGAYFLGPTLTGPPATGTWTSVGTVNDTYYLLTVLTTVQHTLWQRTDAASTSGTIRPLKQIVSGTTTKLVEMTNQEISDLGAYIGEYIRTTGIGQYAIQPSAPGSGTWVDRGSFTDTNNTTAQTGAYIGGYIGTFSAGFTGAFTSQYAGSYQGTYNQLFQGTFTRQFTGNYTGIYTGAFSGNYTGTFTGQYLGTYTKAFTSPLPIGFTGTFAGSYAGVFALRDGLSFQTSTPTAFTGTYNGTSYTKTFTGTYDGTSYTATFAGTSVRAYTGPVPTNFTSGAGPQGSSYTGNWTGGYNSISYTGTRYAYYGAFLPKGYTGSYTGIPPARAGTTYTGSYQGGSYNLNPYATDPSTGGALYFNYTATFAGDYTAYYQGGPVGYPGTYVGSSLRSYTGFQIGSFLLMARWTGVYTGLYANQFFGGGAFFTTYNGTIPKNYSGLSYTRTFQGTYDGTSYTATFAGNYTGIVLGTLYTRTFSGLPTYGGSRDRTWTGIYNRQYTGSFTGPYLGSYSKVFTGSYNQSFTGIFAGGYNQGFTQAFTLSFVGTYTGSYSKTFTGVYGSSFTRDLAFTGVYTGLAVQAATTSNIYTLWVRTA